MSTDWPFFLKTVGFNGATIFDIDKDITCFENNGISYNHPELCKNERQYILDKYMPKMMQHDFNLLQMFSGIKIINQSKVAWFIFRLLFRIFKLMK